MHIIVGFNIEMIVYILFAYWVADHSFQSDWIAYNKHQSIRSMTTHTALYTLVISVLLSWFIPTWLYMGIFVGAIFCSHLVIDTISSTIISWCLSRGKRRWEYAVVSADQTLNTIVLFALLYKMVN